MGVQESFIDVKMETPQVRCITCGVACGFTSSDHPQVDIDPAAPLPASAIMPE